MKVFIKNIILSSVLIGTSSCQEVVITPEKTDDQKSQQAWAGAAEITHYELKQERYGEIRTGEAVLIYVREPFLKDKHVKDESGKGNFQVLKMNFIRKFQTGIYPYHTMVSVFQPLDQAALGSALKTTTSIQEWCGNVFMQTNRRNGIIKTTVNSYFENDDGDVYTDNSSSYLEDEIWTAIRLDPSKLPTGEIKLIPSALSSQFSHIDPSSETATAKWIKGSSDKSMIYEVTYQKTARKLSIEIEKEIPFIIKGWKESTPKKLLSSGKLIKQLKNFDYWNYNSNSDQKKWRKKLDLK